MHKNGGEWTLQKWTPPMPPDGSRNEPEHRVALLAKQEDFETVVLARFGMSLKTIAAFTGLTIGQVAYRLAQAKVRTRDYREGRGPIAAMVFGYCTKRAARQITEDLRNRLDHGT